MANKQYASLIRKTFHDRNCLSIYIKQYKSQRKKWKDTKIQEDKWRNYNLCNQQFSLCPNMEQCRGLSDCAPNALKRFFWALFETFLGLFECFPEYFLSTFLRTWKNFKVTQNLPPNMEQCRGLSDCNSCAPNALKRLNLKLHQNGFNSKLLRFYTHTIWYNIVSVSTISCVQSLVHFHFLESSTVEHNSGRIEHSGWAKSWGPLLHLAPSWPGPLFCMLLANSCTIFLCSLDVRNTDDQCRGPSVKEKDHLAG